MDGYVNKEGYEKTEKEEIFSKAVRAGKRTYFFDVKTTRKKDYYLTVTESKKRFGQDGKPYFEKHKIFLYKEDFDKFADGLDEVVSFIREKQAEEQDETIGETKTQSDYINVEFEDLVSQ